MIHYDVTDKNNNVKVLKVSITDRSIGLTAILVMSCLDLQNCCYSIYIFIQIWLKKITPVNSTLTKSLTTCAVVIKEKKHEFPL